MNKILIANWKMNPISLDDARVLYRAEVKAFREHPDVQVVICPPLIFLEELADEGGTIGAQDTFWAPEGAFTGEVSATMLRAIGISHVLVGHSERRALGETDDMVNKKLKAVIKENMTPVFLVGETEQGSARSDFLIDQLTRGLEGISGEDAGKILFTYEPAWAISSKSGNKSDSPESALSAIHEMQGILERMYNIKPPMLYGGSMNKSNVAEFLKNPEICGGVIGGASLRPEEFASMIEITANI